MQSEHQPSRQPGHPVSEVIQRIVGRPGSLTRLLNQNSGGRTTSESVTPTSVHQEMAQTFPSMYSAPGPSRSLSSYPLEGHPTGRGPTFLARPPKNYLKRVVLVAPGIENVPKGKVQTATAAR